MPCRRDSHVRYPSPTMSRRGSRNVKRLEAPRYTRPRRLVVERSVRMRILVTGHLGYIGSVMVPLLIEEEHEVVGLDTDLYGKCTFGGGSGTSRRSEKTFGMWNRRILEVSM